MKVREKDKERERERRLGRGRDGRNGKPKAYYSRELGKGGGLESDKEMQK